MTLDPRGDLVRLFREEENRPPLLTQPRVDRANGQYTIDVAVADVENDTVSVQLELLNPADGAWLPDEAALFDTLYDHFDRGEPLPASLLAEMNRVQHQLQERYRPSATRDVDDPRDEKA